MSARNQETMRRRNETGKDGVLLTNDSEHAFTNCNFTVDVETATSDFNDDIFQYTGVVSVHSSGSFEFDGSQPPARSTFFNDDGTPKTGNIRLQVQLTGETAHFSWVKINSYERDVPTDGKTTGTVEWEADKLRFS
jgi:hypothetical protein